MEYEEKTDNKKKTPLWMIAIIFILVTFIVAGTIICINSFSQAKNESENAIPILNGTVIPNKGTEITLN